MGKCKAVVTRRPGVVRFKQEEKSPPAMGAGGRFEEED
jgi:hypothetical protein